MKLLDLSKNDEVAQLTKLYGGKFLTSEGTKDFPLIRIESVTPRPALLSTHHLIPSYVSFKEGDKWHRACTIAGGICGCGSIQIGQFNRMYGAGMDDVFDVKYKEHWIELFNILLTVRVNFIYTQWGKMFSANKAKKMCDLLGFTSVITYENTLHGSGDTQTLYALEIATKKARDFFNKSEEKNVSAPFSTSRIKKIK